MIGFKKLLFRLLFLFISFSIVLFINFIIFKPIYYANSLIFPYAIHPFDIVSVYPYTWYLLKKYYFITLTLSSLIILNKLFNIIFLNNLFKKFNFFKLSISNNNNKYLNDKKNQTDLSLFVGMSENTPVYISEKGLYQNILITGTIGTGKTSSAMYPFTSQLIKYNSNSQSEKLAMLILDVKGNYYRQVLEYANTYNRLNDIILIDLSGRFKYNPLDKPNLNPIVLANRLKTILTIFSPNNSESFWLDKAEQILAEFIKFCRIYNNGYVSFAELHKLLMFPDYYYEKISVCKNLFKNGILTKIDSYNLLTCIDFFEKEFFSLDSRTLSILKSEISRITNIFISDYNVSKSFCPSKEDINFKGFKEVLEDGKIVVLNMNISEYKNLSKIIATYLKLDFQTEVMSRLSSTLPLRKSAFISDEFHEYVTSTDADFLSQSREAKCINIIATQSYSSIKNSLKDDNQAKVIIQNMINKLWFRTDDIFTIEEIQKHIGKEEKTKISTTISENAKETKVNFITNHLMSTNSNLSESYNKYTQNDYIYDTNFFTQNLESFQCIAFISNGLRILKPLKLQMIPYYEKDKLNFKY